MKRTNDNKYNDDSYLEVKDNVGSVSFFGWYKVEWIAIFCYHFNLKKIVCFVYNSTYRLKTCVINIYIYKYSLINWAKLKRDIYIRAVKWDENVHLNLYVFG